jgi:hypothetical protein
MLAGCRKSGRREDLQRCNHGARPRPSEYCVPAPQWRNERQTSNTIRPTGRLLAPSMPVSSSASCPAAAEDVADPSLALLHVRRY